jgi:hypothetical protein
VIWISQGEDEENAGPGTADAPEAAFDRDDRCEAWRTGERAYHYQFPSKKIAELVIQRPVLFMNT